MRMSSLFLNEAEKGFLQALADEGVRYVLIGGHAVNFHGYERPVEDLDLVIEASMENARRFLAVYDRLVPIPRPAELTIEKLLKPKTKVPIPYYGIEALTSIDAVPFRELYRDSIAIESGGPTEGSRREPRRARKPSPPTPAIAVRRRLPEF
jgi:hypothetical protein